MLSRDSYETYWVQNISLIYLFVIFAVEQGGSGLTVFDSCYIPGSLLSLIWSKLMKRRQGQHQPWIGGPRAVTRIWVAFGKGDGEIITGTSASQTTLARGIYDAGLLESCQCLRKERLLGAGTNWGVTNGIPEEMSCYLVLCLPSGTGPAHPGSSVIFIEH